MDVRMFQVFPLQGVSVQSLKLSCSSLTRESDGCANLYSCVILLISGMLECVQAFDRDGKAHMFSLEDDPEHAISGGLGFGKPY